MTLVAQVAVSALQQGLPNLATALQGQFGLSLTALGVMLGIANASTAASVLWWGGRSDRLGDRAVLLQGLPLGGIGLLVAAVGASAGSALTVIAGLCLGGLGAAAGSVALASALVSRVGPGHAGSALGLRQAAVPIGGLLAALALPAAGAVGGLSASLGLLGIGLLLGAELVRRWLGAPMYPSSDRVTRGRPTVLTDRRPRKTPGLPLALGTAGLLCITQTGTVALSVSYWRGQLGLSTALAAGLFAGAQGLTAALRVWLGRRADRSASADVVLIGGVAAIGAVLLGAMAFLRATTASVGAQAALLAIACASVAAFNGLAFAQVTRLVRHSPSRAGIGRVHGALNTVLFAAAGGTPPLAALLVSQTGWDGLWVCLSACAVAGFVCQRRLARLSPSTQPRSLQCASPLPTTSY